ncbi:hypothetical protein PGT21_050161 [Puccinia graminis f. sp. tritici]|uniref:DUF4219 domain-containing protein n=1 Tax=Puccinia graminis f. sp. tritici TaxID=56615 RepID=A0A5B0Q089_PUCGR|nr:hypothetical protein PGT21_050161 [Puccinia graminis f. sp. tritici]
MSNETESSSKPNQASTTKTTEASSNSMEKINAMILKTAIEAIPLLTQDNFSMWKTRVINYLEIQKLKDAVVEGKGKLSNDEELQVRTVITSKLDPSVHSNVINHENESSAVEIWNAIINHFASTQAANRARVWNHFSHLPFDNSDINGFMTKIRSAIGKMHEVGIQIDTDVVGYEILKKLPKTTELNGLSTAVTHSGLDMTPDLVLDHLRLHANNQVIASNSLGGPVPAQVSLFTDASKKCKSNAHNTLANHPLQKCWMLYPHLRPANGNRQPSSRSESTT